MGAVRAADAIVVIGAGNRHRGDDGAGLLAAERLRAQCDRSVNVLSLLGEATAIMAAWQDCHTAFVVDAVASGADAGRVYRFEAIEQPLPADLLRFSTHGFGVADAIELGRALGKLPQRIVVYGIEGADFSAGAGVSEPVAAAIDEVVELIMNDIKEGLAPCMKHQS